MSEGETFSMSGVSSSSCLRNDDDFFCTYFNSFTKKNNWFFATKSGVSNSLELFMSMNWRRVQVKMWI